MSESMRSCIFVCGIIVRFSDSLALPRASGLGNLTTSQWLVGSLLASVKCDPCYLWESYNVLQSKEEEEPFVGKQWAWCAVANAAVSNLTTKRRKRPERPRLFISQGSGSIQDLNKGKLRIKIPTTRVFGPKVAFGPDQIQQQNLRPNCQSINFKLYIVNKALIICGKQYIILILRKILCLDHRCFTSPVPEH